MKYINYSIVIADSAQGDSVFLQTLPEVNMSKGHQLDEVHLGYIVSFTIAFFLVGIIGVLGNILVIFVIFHDKKMRKSLTNMLIVNLAVADSIILIFGIPEIVQFMLNRGWILGEAMCRIQRTVLVISLYVSVLTLVALCIER
jgi:thyrotropin-releasing hormone receptor